MSKGHSFLKGAAILGMAGVLVKILGAIYRIPLSNIIKSEGLGYYQTAYPFYVLLLTISTAGVPVAIAKLVSEKRAKGDFAGAHKVFKVALVGLVGLGFLTSMVIAFGASYIVNYLGNVNAYYALVALVPALFFVPIMSAFRGFFQGRQSMFPTALSQITEQLFRVVTGLGLTYLLLDKGIPIAAGGASFGGSMGAIMGLAIIVFIYFKRRTAIMEEIAGSTITREYSVGEIAKDLLLIAIPITIGAAIAPIMDTIDAALVLRRLQSINYTAAEANALYGELKGMAQTLVNLPQVFSIAISMSLVPAISNASARKSRQETSDLISSGIRMTLLIGLPSAIGLFVLSTPIVALLYYNNPPEAIASVGNILAYLSLGVIFLTLVQALTAILQGLGKPFVPVKNLFIGAVAKIILTYVLTGIPAINVKGAAISTVAAYAIASTLNLLYVIYVAKAKLNLRSILMKPLISAVGMGIIARVSYMVLAGPIGGRPATLVAVLLGVVAYGVLLLLTGTLTDEDLDLIPKGDKFRKLVKRFDKWS
ncbi:putative polysaccharide biosynthesis protein [Gudongella sp. SC589]|jgi:stage V sporulation protein B|uniref:putative polysaccharide biosynthesis protein n=1 Tax=Gudongella sp. SC589 TaxID=3385990 RepID=UPI003904BA09